MNTFELLGPSEERAEGSALRLRWPEANKTAQIKTGLDWALSQYGSVQPAARDLLRIAAAAYMADRQTPRPLWFSRSISIVVHVDDPDLWTGSAGEAAVDLLHWISGDTWTLTPVISSDTTADPEPLADAPQFEDVMLLSGGLDSFCGAADHFGTSTTRLHIGHRDAATSVRAAQKHVDEWFKGHNPNFSWLTHALRETAKAREHTTRTRSLLFMAMGIAAATGTGASSLVVPENGSTSLNYPLIPSRGGAFTTKSTHPYTFHILNGLLREAAIPIAVVNPYAWLTKGELLEKALASAPDGFLAATASTLSCAKLDSGRFRGGQPNLNCGICYACFVRRGSYAQANVQDPTEYLVDRLTGFPRQKLIKKRHDDLWALELAEKMPITEDDLIATAAWPPGYDIDKALDLVKRGREEVNRVARP